MRLSTTTSITQLARMQGSYTIEESLRMNRKAGYAVQDLNLMGFSLDEIPFVLHADCVGWAHRVRELADALGVELSQAHAYYDPKRDTSPEALAKTEAFVGRSIELAAIVGAKWLVVHPVTIREHGWFSHAASLAYNKQYFGRLGALARKKGVGIAIENMIESRRGRAYCTGAEELLELVGALHDSVFGVCWDFGHAHLSYHDQPAALRRLGGRLKATHVHDNHRETDEHLAPYFGTIDWPPILRMLCEIGYAGDFSYEIQSFTGAPPRAGHEALLRFTYELGQHMLRL